MNQERCKYLFDYDGETGKLLWKNPKAHRLSPGDEAGSITGRGYLNVFINGHTWQVHHLIWLWCYGNLPTELDHLDGNRKNNRIANLREANPSVNGRNKKIYANNTSGITGVRWVERDRRWHARISFNGKRKHLGSFVHKEQAIRARENFINNHPELGFTQRHGK